MSDRNVLPFSPADHDDADIAARVAALYAHTPTPDAGQIDRCARAVLAQAMHQPTRSILGMPRTRWWWGAAAAAAVILTITHPWTTATPRASDSTTVASATTVGAQAGAALQGSVTELGHDAVRFDLQLPAGAVEVAIVGDFNGWNQQATPMARRDGTWSAKVPLAPGRHVYAFVVDGKRWVVDPLAPQVPDDGYGPANAVVIDATPK